MRISPHPRILPPRAHPFRGMGGMTDDAMLLLVPGRRKSSPRLSMPSESLRRAGVRGGSAVVAVW